MGFRLCHFPYHQLTFNILPNHPLPWPHYKPPFFFMFQTILLPLSFLVPQFYLYHRPSHHLLLPLPCYFQAALYLYHIPDHLFTFTTFQTVFLSLPFPTHLPLPFPTPHLYLHHFPHHTFTISHTTPSPFPTPHLHHFPHHTTPLPFPTPHHTFTISHTKAHLYVPAHPRHSVHRVHEERHGRFEDLRDLLYLRHAGDLCHREPRRPPHRHHLQPEHQVRLLPGHADGPAGRVHVLLLSGLRLR